MLTNSTMSRELPTEFVKEQLEGELKNILLFYCTYTFNNHNYKISLKYIINNIQIDDIIIIQNQSILLLFSCLSLFCSIMQIQIKFQGLCLGDLSAKFLSNELAIIGSSIPTYIFNATIFNNLFTNYS